VVVDVWIQTSLVGLEVWVKGVGGHGFEVGPNCGLWLKD
jgi:hypothetical protein